MLECSIELGPSLMIEQVVEAKATLVDALKAWPGDAPFALGCAALCEVDGAGLQLLTMLAIEVRERGGDLQLADCSASLQRTIRESGLAAWFSFDTGGAA